ncbi:MAG: hypothetical protein EKK48_01795 [Candidatus Melainabacteria bacterium]|nr:MAG: hypothetical protein EKK48_01795 [Candidatus Melainabacteria bacterium]
MTNQIRLISMILEANEVDTSMIGQTEMPSKAMTNKAIKSPMTEQSRPWPPYDDEPVATEGRESTEVRPLLDSRKLESRKSKSSGGSHMYALSFIIPATTVSAIYLPDAIQSGNCALATIPAVLAGCTAFGLYRFCKFIKHRK